MMITKFSFLKKCNNFFNMSYFKIILYEYKIIASNVYKRVLSIINKTVCIRKIITFFEMKKL